MLNPMPGPPAGRPPIVRALGTSLALLGLSLGLLIAIEIAVPVQGGSDPLWVALLAPSSAVVFLITGAVAWWRRPSNRTGAIMLWGAVLLVFSGLDVFGVGWLASVSVVLATMTLPVLVHLLLAFPSGRVRSWTARWTVLAGYAVSLVLQLPLYLFDPRASPGGMLAIGDVPVLRTIGNWLQRGCGMAVMVVAAVILAHRFRRSGRRERRVIGPLYLYGIAAVLAVPVIPSVIRPLTGMPAEVSYLLQIGLLTAVPVTVGCAMLLGGFARTSEVQELGAWLGSADRERVSLQHALADSLGDPSVRLAFWADEVGRYVDRQGRPVLVPDPAPGRATVDIGIGGRRVAAIGYDAGLIDDPGLVASAGRVVALALDRERLTAELRASRNEVRLSRMRIVQAGDRERRRIAQNLHDGLQAELVLLGVQAQGLADIPGATTEVAAAATDLRLRIDRAASDLRQLVHAVMPPPLVERGLTSAVEDLVDRMPVPTRLDIGDLGVLPGQLQSTAYFVVAEGLANAVKHARATKISVRLARAHQQLSIQVADDGVGGASIGGGRGLGGLTDRVDALAGRLTVDSPDGRGTRLLVELPCEF
jgi:signal transduction histidine kinase